MENKIDDIIKYLIVYILLSFLLVGILNSVKEEDGSYKRYNNFSKGSLIIETDKILDKGLTGIIFK